DFCNERGQLLELFLGIIESGNEQGYEFDPNSHRVKTSDSIEDRADATAEFVIMAVAETLQVHLVKINPWAQIFENLRGSISVGNESGEEARGFRGLKDRYRPFTGD